MISTELESTEQIYERISGYVDETQCHIDNGEEEKNKLKTYYNN